MALLPGPEGRHAANGGEGMAANKATQAKVLDDDRLLVPDEVAAFLRVSRRTLETWRYQGDGPNYIKVGGLVRYRASDISAWLVEQSNLN